MAFGAAAIELTRRCNLSCSHCTLVHPSLTDVPGVDELSRRQIIRIVDGLADAGISPVGVYGGEIYLRRDLESILRHMASRHVRVLLDTNATLLTSRRADFLSELLPERVQVPVFGATAAAYEAVTGVPGSFALFERGVELLVRRRITVRLRGVRLEGQGAQTEAMEALAADLGVALEIQSPVESGVRTIPAQQASAGRRAARTWPVIQSGEGGRRVVIWCTR